MIKSISYNQEEIINNILTLHTDKKIIDADITYSTGQFYKNGIVPMPNLKYDIKPQSNDVIAADSRNLPLESESLSVIMFDPPFLATTGKSLVSNENNNYINKRFGVYNNEQELHNFYIDTLKETYRILKPNGILIFKCQDKISSGKQYMSHVFIINEAEKIGYYCKDMFILLAKSRLIADWQLKNQKNARKFHSYFLVLQKNNKKIKYI